MASLAGGSQWWTSHVHHDRWPLVQATIRKCEIVPRRRRNSAQTAQVLECSIEFTDRGGNRVQGGVSARPAYVERDIRNLRAWMAEHPAGSILAVHYNPEWPPETEPDQPGAVFYDAPQTLVWRIAGIAAAIGVALLGLALFVRPSS
jgi:hypothetical protein